MVKYHMPLTDGWKKGFILFYNIPRIFIQKLDYHAIIAFILKVIHMIIYVKYWI